MVCVVCGAHMHVWAISLKQNLALWSPQLNRLQPLALTPPPRDPRSRSGDPRSQQDDDDDDDVDTEISDDDLGARLLGLIGVDADP